MSIHQTDSARNVLHYLCMPITRSILAGLAVVLLLCGCNSPERAVRDVRKTGSEIAGEFMGKVTGRTNEFTIARPADWLRNRLLAEQGLDPALAAAEASSDATAPEDASDRR